MITFGEVLHRARQLLTAGELAQAEPIYRRLIEAAPQAAEPWHELGILQLHAGHPEAAVESLRRAVSLDPNKPTYHSNLATTYRMLKRPNEAIASFQRAMQLASPTAELLNNLALSLKDTGQLDAALRAFDDALRLRPRYSNGHFNRGNLLVELGRLEEATASYQLAIDAQPDDAVAHCKLGMVYCELGRSDEFESPGSTMALDIAKMRKENLRRAVACFRRALELEPDFAEAYSDLAVALTRQNQLDEAADCCRRALELKPQFADAQNNLGAVLEKQGRLSDAADCWRHALRWHPDFVEAHHNLAAVASKQGHLAEATDHWRRALALQPNSAAASSNLAAVLEKQGQFDEAIRYWRRTLDLTPGAAQIHNNLGALLARQEKFDDAETCFRRAIELEEDFPAALHNLAGLLARQERLDEAAARWRRALELKSDFAEASAGLGSLLSQQGRFAEARQCYQSAIQEHPDQAIWRLSQLTLCPVVFGSNQEIDAFRQSLLAELAGFAQQRPKFDPDELSAVPCAPSFNLQFHGRDDRSIREAHARLFDDSLPKRVACGSAGRQRIGFVVTDSHEPGFIKSMGPIVERMDPSRFELVILVSNKGVGAVRSALRSSPVELVGLPDKFDDVVAVIAGAGCDLLYYWEVGTDSMNYCLPFLRLAPVQCTSWGIQVTSGIAEMDCYLSSALVEVDDAQHHYTEKLLLANTLLTYQRRATLGDRPKTREDFGIAPGRHLYLCAQQAGKFQPDFDEILAGILRRDPAGVIVVTEDHSRPLVAEQLRARLAASLQDLFERMVFMPSQPASDYLSLIAAADVLLDPLHFGGVNSTYDGFSLNQPIVTLPSRFQRGRYTLACYKKMGICDCVAASKEQYIDIAVALGTDIEFRAAVVDKIEQASHVLFEDIEAVREHERIFGELIERASSADRRLVV